MKAEKFLEDKLYNLAKYEAMTKHDFWERERRKLENKLFKEYPELKKKLRKLSIFAGIEGYYESMIETLRSFD